MATGGVGEAMLIGAITGSATSAVTGGDPLKGALIGAAGAGAFSGAAGATSGAASGGASGTATGTGTAAAGTTGLQFATPSEFDALMNVTQTDPSFMSFGDTGIPTQTLGSGTRFSDIQSLTQTPTAVIDPALSGTSGVPVATDTTFRSGTVASGTPAENPMFPNINKFYRDNPIAVPAGAGAFANLLAYKPEEEKEDEYVGSLSRFSYSPDRYTSYAASGGLMDTAPARRMAAGGQLGSYSDGGQTLQGPGDGMSDSIPASIGGVQPARLADGEFVVPADVVSGIGNGSTDAGARQLYSMMDKVREARTGRTRQAPEINPNRMMPA